MQRKSLIWTICIQAVCWSVIGWLLIVEPNQAQAIGGYQVSTPVPFLGAIYYNKQDVWKIFDHDLPVGGPGDDGNTYVTHYDGSIHLAVTATYTPGPPPGTPAPTPAPYVPRRYGYDEHLGIDYSLQYEPVLAAASGNIVEAGWDNSANHRTGYGLHVVISHTANANYQTWYGHLSTLTVKQGDTIVISSSDPGNRSRIIGISGNTGNIFGSNGLTCAPIDDDPNTLTCGQHLHFEVRTNDTVVNPYGWVATGTPDPWAPPIGDGEVSYNLWATLPAVSPYTDQYPGSSSTPLDEPVVNDTRFIIDNSSADFSTSGSFFCNWATPTGDGSFNEEYRSITANLLLCKAKWTITRDAFMPTGDYDVYVHMPDALNASRSAVYSISQGGKIDQAVVVQAAYPNPDHPDPWAYIGQYRSDIEYISLSSQTLLGDNSGNQVLADAIRLVPSQAALPPRDTVYVSFDIAGTIGGVAFEDEDILAYDTRSSEWSIYFDTSTEGVTTNVDAFALLYDQSILLSFSIPTFVPDGVGTVDDSDIVRFSPITGQFSLHHSATQMGLNPLDENQDIDTIAFSPSPGSKLLISTRGTFNGYEDADLLMVNFFQPPLLSFYFDGSDVGLTDVGTTDAPEGVDGAWVDSMSGQIYLSTKGLFSVSGASGDGSDIFVCTPENTGTSTSCTFGWEPGVGLFWNGSAHGVGAYHVDGFSIGAVPLPSDCS